MAEDCTDGDYLGAYSRFFAEFVARVNPHDQLPVSVSACNVTEGEIVGEIIGVTLQYLNQAYCPASLQAHLVHQVIQEIKSICKKQPEDCGFKTQEKTYASLKLMQAITGKVNEICTRYLDNSRLALLPPPPSTPLPQVITGASKNCRRKMEDRHVVIHDLHTTFGIHNDLIANYYAVFDGHAGQDAAVYCATHLHQYLVESIYYPTDPERALHDAFVTTDAQFIAKSQTQRVCGGTTAVCALVLNKKLHVAWAGDSIAILIKRGTATQLVNPHRLSRADEVTRILKMGGVVIDSMGILRVNGVLSVSRAIGDVQYKPFVSGDPEVTTVPLDGTEDFLVLVSDGVSDFLSLKHISTLLYHEIRRCPNSVKNLHLPLLQWAKRAGSSDNITAIVVLLTPASEIATRPQEAHPFYCPNLDDILDNMNSKDNPLLLDTDERREPLHPGILKQTLFPQEPQDDDILASSNGKHENGDAVYDYSDLGPETDVDAVDDVATTPVKNHAIYPCSKDDDSSQDEDQEEKDAPNLFYGRCAYGKDDELSRDQVEKDIDTLENNKINVDGKPRDVENNSHGIRDDIENKLREDVDKQVNDEDAAMDYSPEVNKTLQHAVIPEAENVADSEDSEDEWNYYPVDPKKEDSRVAEEQPPESKGEQEADSSELVGENNFEIQSEEVERHVKCESPKEEVSPELIDTEISAEDKPENEKEETLAEDNAALKDMDFQLNPDAAEFVPVSPQALGNRRHLGEDFPISGSPLKEVWPMDDIQVPTQSEFDEEICRRPREIEGEEKDCTNGDHVQSTNYTDFITDRQKNLGISLNLDDSEISSTKAEFGDESSFLTASEFHRTGVSTIDGSFTSSERDYDIAKDPMAQSFAPSDFEAAFEKPCDLNAVHDLSTADLIDTNGVEEEGVGPESPDFCGNLTADSAENDKTVEDVCTSSTQNKEDEGISTENKDEPVEDFLAMQPERQPQFEHDAYKSDHSPLTENFSESEKEAISVNDEQLSPSSEADDKRIDDVAPATEPRPEVCPREADSTLQPWTVADAPEKEGELIPAMENVPPTEVPEFGADFHVSPETRTLTVADFTVFDSQFAKPVEQSDYFDVFSREAAETRAAAADQFDVFQNEAEGRKETVQEPAATESPVEEPAKGNMLDFGVDEGKVEAETVAQPLVQEELICLAKSSDGDNANVKQLEEDLGKPEVCQLPAAVLEPSQNLVTLNLSESMQEFTGLEKQLLPEIVAPVDVAPPVAEPEKADDFSAVEKEAQPALDEVPESKPAPEAVALDKKVEALAATAVAGVAAASKTKAKPATKSTKTTTQAKPAPKSTPTSPSKTTSAMRTSTVAKKPAVTARPKDLDAAKKPLASTLTSKPAPKPAAAKPAVLASKPPTTAAKTARTNNGALKPKPTTAPLRSSVDKKPTANGDVKPLTKPATKTLSRPATTATAAPKTALVKPPSATRTSTSTTTKPRPTSAAKPTLKPAPATTLATARPKTAPATAGSLKPRTSTAKSPMIDKQIKETANKQISLARSTASSLLKTNRTSSSTTSSTTTVKRTSTSKTTVSTSPTKKATPTTKVVSRTSAGNKAKPATVKVKVVQNGVSESNAIITTNNKHEDDVPKKDLSPVVAPTDNQLIMSSD